MILQTSIKKPKSYLIAVLVVELCRSAIFDLGSSSFTESELLGLYVTKKNVQLLDKIKIN